MTHRTRSSWRTSPLLAVLVFAATTVARPRATDDIRLTVDRPFDVKHIKLELDIDLETQRADAVATLSMTALRRVNSVKLDAVEFKTHGVRLAIGSGAAEEVEFAHDGKHIEVEFAEPLSAGQDITLFIDYSIDNPPRGMRFFKPSASNPDEPYQLWTQGQSIFNRYWVPCFDHPGERQTTEIIATVDSKFLVSSNGELVSKEPADEAGKTTWHWLQDKPHVSYLMTLVVGEFAFKEESWRGIPVRYYVPPDRAADIENSFGNTLRMLDFFSDKIGVDYPWDQYAQLCCYQFGGGMENTSATTMTERTLHDNRAHLDTSSDSLVAHELAHQWFGDMTTCREWAHLWLNEGFASYFQALWTEHDLGPDEFAFDMWRKTRGAIRGGKEKPIVYRHYEHPREQFDSRAYPKAAWVLHMLRARLGEEVFWKAINRFATEYAYDVVETADFRRAVEHVSGRNFERFFYDWTQRPGHPVLEVEYAWNEKDKVASVTVTQTQEADAFHFPLRLDFHTGKDFKPTTVVHDLTQKEAAYKVPLESKPTLFRVDPGNTVLKELTVKKDRYLWEAQLRNDPDPIGRLRAAKHLADTKTDANRKLFASALRDEKFRGVQSEIAGALGRMGGDIARDALIAGLRFENARARRSCVEALGRFKDDAAAMDALRPIVTNGDASYRVEAAAIKAFAKLGPDDAFEMVRPTLDRESHREMIRNAALRALANLKDPAVLEILLAWTERDKPDTCRRIAIRALADVAKEEDVQPEVAERAVHAIAACVGDADRRLRGAAVNALESLGRAAAPALPTLHGLAASATDTRVRSAAKGAIESIREDWPLEDQVADLHATLQRLLEENESLRTRLDRLESRYKSSTEAAKSGAVTPDTGASADAGAGG